MPNTRSFMPHSIANGLRGTDLGELSPNFTYCFFRLWLTKKTTRAWRLGEVCIKKSLIIAGRVKIQWHKSAKPLLSELVLWKDLSQDLISYSVFQVIPVIFSLQKAGWIAGGSVWLKIHLISAAADPQPPLSLSLTCFHLGSGCTTSAKANRCAPSTPTG